MEVQVNSMKGASGAFMERCLISAGVLAFSSFIPETREGHEELGDKIVRCSFCPSGANKTVKCFARRIHRVQMEWLLSGIVKLMGSRERNEAGLVLGRGEAFKSRAAREQCSWSKG